MDRIEQDAILSAFAAAGMASDVPDMLYVGEADVALLFAQRIASLHGRTLHGLPRHEADGGTADLVACLTKLEAGDLLFAGDLQALPEAVFACLRQAIGEHTVSVRIGAAPAQRSITLDLQPFKVIASVRTREARMAALQDAFGLVVDISALEGVDAAGGIIDDAAGRGLLARGAADEGTPAHQARQGQPEIDDLMARMDVLRDAYTCSDYSRVVAGAFADVRERLLALCSRYPQHAPQMTLLAAGMQQLSALVDAELA